MTLQVLQEQLEQSQSSDLVNGNVVSPLTAEVEGLRQENSLYKQQVDVSIGVGAPSVVLSSLIGMCLCATSFTNHIKKL